MARMRAMKVLVINVGSTSVKYQVYEMDTETTLARGGVERVGSSAAEHKFEVGASKGKNAVKAGTVAEALAAVLEHLPKADGPVKNVVELRAVGHRVVHGGAKLVQTVVVPDVVTELSRGWAG